MSILTASRNRTRPAGFTARAFQSSKPPARITSAGQRQATLHRINRRTFLRGAGAGVALVNILPGSLIRGAERLTPNEQLNIAGIGIGSRGGADLEEIAKLGHNIVALCDVDEKYAAKEFAKYPKATRFTDYRVMLDKMGKQFDGV